ncbi:MAG: hypothetical protein JSS72_05550 [Armatimonadetes bacterium]|nr:hypothetical protein [Armatimonadota bacterium]
MFAATLFLSLVLNPAVAGPSGQGGWSETEHDVVIRAKKFHYAAKTGYLNLTGEKEDDVQARIFFTSYSIPSDPNRPITFVWNGGPGASSMLMHMRNLGPRKLVALDDKQSKFGVENNDNSLLPTTDLVFMDPVGTGFSKAVGVDEKSFWGANEDLQATQRFIQRYLEVTGRVKAPVFLAGESYGTFRAAGLAYPLLQRGIDVRGLILISNAIRMSAHMADSYNDAMYVGFLPTYTATAAFHKKLGPELNGNIQKAISESMRFAQSEYLPALAKGDELAPSERKELAKKLSALTGIDADTYEKSHLRLDPERFRTLITASQHKPVDIYNGSLIGAFLPDSKPSIERFREYLDKELGFTEQGEYIPLNIRANANWKWGSALGGPPSVMDRLRTALVKYPSLRVFVAQGCYDFATPFFSSMYTMKHLGLPDEIKDHWQLKVYEGGHMMYLEPEAHVKLHDDLEQFMTSLK